MRINHNEHLSLTSSENDSFYPCQAPAQAILESISDGVFTVDKNWRITYFNNAAEEITGISRHEALGKPCNEIFQSNMCADSCALHKTLTTGIPVINKPACITNASGHRVSVSISTAILRNSNDEIIGCAETFRDLSLVERLRNELERRVQIGGMLTRSPVMTKVFDVLPQIAASDSTVLIEGETGTGKELFARAIHNLSNRRSKPFIALNCSALPDTLLESELFGYKAGAFTGAEKDKLGRFGVAEGGTLFLDEIGEISPALQVKLLRVLQEKTYEPLGSSYPIKANVRIICATNQCLANLVEDKKFRPDLYYRIDVVNVNLPPLKKRKEDIPLLVDHFISNFNHIQGKSVDGVTHDVMTLLMSHEFPGNIRELENIIEHAFVLCSDGFIDISSLPRELTRKSYYPKEKESVIDEVVHAVEAQAIVEAIKRNNNNRVAAARELGIHKSTLFRKIKALGIHLPHTDGRSRNPMTGPEAE